MFENIDGESNGIFRECSRIILVIMPFFFEYEFAIKNALIKRNNIVFILNDNIEDTSFLLHCFYYIVHKIKNISDRLKFNKLTIFWDRLLQWADDQYFYKRITKLQKRFSIDSVLIIKGERFSNSILRYLKNTFKSKIIMYQWDSAIRVKNISNLASICSKHLTFDMADAIAYNWKYRPLFFMTSNQCKISQHQNKTIDIVFICSLHSERELIWNKAENYTRKNNLKLFSHVYVGRVSFFVVEKYINANPLYQIDSNKINFKKLHLSETNRIYDQSFAILDYKFPEQNGLTMRSIEALGHRCKLITNNRNIVNEPFYNPNNIYIYDYEDVEKNGFNIPSEFFSTPYQDVPEDILYRYTIDGWIDDIFGKSESSFER